MRIHQIITGGQTGVDRAAMDFALEHNITLCGWCPKGRKAEDGVIDHKYPLQETPSADYQQRTTWNVRDSDGVLIITRGKISGGTALGVSQAQTLGKPTLIVDLNTPADLPAIRTWIKTHTINNLGIGGPRESHCPGIYQQTIEFLGVLRLDGQ